ncbi:MAG: hypothetical protein GW886_04160 [Rhodobacterales bacterium]|nr:hypothetical protein [Rhodobacterales bacterium]NCT12709.1 hypothetical protein [Rhodobacterales bacterium]
MRRVMLAVVVLALAVAVWLWGFGGAAQVAQAAGEGQRAVQNAMAGALRQLKAGEMGALVTLWGLCFAYGFFHAAGPGHGKLVIGGYGLGRRVPMGRLAGLAVVASLAQALTAVVLVYAGLLLLGMAREDMQGFADGTMAVVSNALIGLIGLWLLARGARRLWRRPWPGLWSGLWSGLWPGRAAPVEAVAHDLHAVPMRDHDHPHSGDGMCETCGHAHGPTLAQAAEVRSLRDAGMVVGAIAARPCTGALFLLILTWRLGIDWAGIIGAFVMALGTASITLVVAVASVSLRESALAQAASGPQVARLAAVIEVLAGAMVLVLAGQMILRAL